jgi:nucleoside-diphosphate-sugar epimerase
MKNILVTGGSGFLGSNISNYLVKEGYNVTVLDNNSRGNLKRIENNKRIKFIKGDIRKKKDIKKSLKKIDTIVHLAYINGTKYFYEKPVEILDVGIKGIFNLLELCEEHKIKNFFLASSSEVYQTPNKVPTDEKEMLKIPDVYNPRYSYGAGKIISELICLYYSKKILDKLIIFRPHNVYGPDMGREHVIPEFLHKAKLNKTLNVRGEGKEVRSFIHINDFLDAFGLIFKKGKNREIYNIGTNEKINIKQLALKIAKKYNKKIKLEKSKIFKGNTNIRCPDIKKIKKLGFKQKIKLDAGINLIINENDK